MRPIELSFIKRSKSAKGGPVVYATVRNEAYFLPHFLAHYRHLGVKEFWFLDDHSDDATIDILSKQDDVTVLRSNYRFGEMCGKLRFGILSRTIVPKRFLSERWVLTVDLDEFLLLPDPFTQLPDFLDTLNHHGLRTCRALMVDFFPRFLCELEGLAESSNDKSPFELSPFFDVYTHLNWPDLAEAPVWRGSHQGVRHRLYGHLFAHLPEARELRRDYRFANNNKVPLIRWSDDARMLSAHRTNLPVRDVAQLILAHFKFFPGYLNKISDALSTGAYWNGSIEYRMLDLASRSFSQLDLLTIGTPTIGQQREDMISAGLLYSRLASVSS